MIIRCFLLRFFSWLNNKELKLEYRDLNQDFSHYYKYLINESRNRGMFVKFIELKNYSIDYRFKLRFTRSELEEKLINIKTENEFRKKILIPILEDLGYNNIQESHGAHEFGIDILFSNINKFGIIEWNGIVAKIGNINLEEGTTLNQNLRTIFNQMYQAKSIQHSDINYGNVKITRVFVVTNGIINFFAKEALSKKDPLIEGNIFFIDRNILLKI